MPVEQISQSGACLAMCGARVWKDIFKNTSLGLFRSGENGVRKKGLPGIGGRAVALRPGAPLFLAMFGEGYS